MSNESPYDSTSRRSAGASARLSRKMSQPLFQQLGHVYFSYTTPLSTVACFYAHGGTILTSQDPCNLPVKLYFVPPGDRLAPYLMARGFVVYDPRWVEACAAKMVLVDLGHFVVLSPVPPMIPGMTRERARRADPSGNSLRSAAKPAQWDTPTRTQENSHPTWSATDRTDTDTVDTLLTATLTLSHADRPPPSSAMQPPRDAEFDLQTGEASVIDAMMPDLGQINEQNHPVAHVFSDVDQCQLSLLRLARQDLPEAFLHHQRSQSAKMQANPSSLWYRSQLASDWWMFCCDKSYLPNTGMLDDNAAADVEYLQEQGDNELHKVYEDHLAACQRAKHDMQYDMRAWPYGQQVIRRDIGHQEQKQEKPEKQKRQKQVQAYEPTELSSIEYDKSQSHHSHAPTTSRRIGGWRSIVANKLDAMLDDEAETEKIELAQAERADQVSLNRAQQHTRKRRPRTKTHRCSICK